jgi:epsilon-lactone hydrolase
MTEQTAFGPNPIPAEPSPESVQLRKRVSANRRIQERTKACGVSLRLLRLTMNLAAFTARAPKGGTARPVRYANGVSGRLVTAAGASSDNGILMWVHGGGFVSGSPRVEQGLAARYSELCGLPVFMPAYRLAPEHPFPAAPDDVLDAYLSLLRQDFPADRIRLCGMSAGGALVTGLLGDLVRGGLPMPGAALLLSPVLDLSAKAARRQDEIIPDPFVSPTFVERTNRAYVGEAPLSDPRIDLLGADMRTWPPILVQTGGTECLAGEAELLGAAMRAAGARCEVQLWPGQIHGFVGLGLRTVPEARAALDYGIEFLRRTGEPAPRSDPGSGAGRDRDLAIRPARPPIGGPEPDRPMDPQWTAQREHR